MKSKLLISFILVLFFSSEVFAATVEYNFATVIEAEPIFESQRVSTPRKECWEEEVAYNDRNFNRNEFRGDRRRGVSTLVGGVIGGAFGKAVGHRKRNR